MKNEKSAKTQDSKDNCPAIDIYRFAFYYSPDGFFDDHNCTRQRGICLEMRSAQRELYIDLETRKYGNFEPLYPGTARNLRETIYNWMKDSLLEDKKRVIEVNCDRKKENNGANYGLELKQFKLLSPAERKMVEESLKACKKRGEPDIRLVFQKNGKK